MKQLFILAMILSGVPCFGNIFTGTLLCKETGKPIEYANIGIIGKNIGTTSDINGKFSIPLDEMYDTDRLRISSIGFEALEMKVEDFKSKYKNEGVIYLPQQNVALKELVFKPHKYHHKRFGNTANSKMLVATFDTSVRGYEAGVFMEIRKAPTFIDSIRINMAGCECDTIFLRINVYELIDSDFVNILKEPVYVAVPSEEVKKHHISIDLSKKNIMVTHNFMVSLELVKDDGGKRMFYCASLLSSNGYVRKTSQGYWHRTPGVATGISAYVTY